MSTTRSRLAPGLSLVAALAVATPLAPAVAQDQAQPQLSAAEVEKAGETWKAIRGDILGERPITDGAGIVELEAPYRAHDAAIVPLDITARLPQGRTVKAMTLVIDENPAPVAATFTFGTARPDLSLSTRVRINSYSYVRAIVEADDGTLYMTTRYVKASGGCSAPALKDADQALANLGKMKMRYPPAAATPAAVPVQDAARPAGSSHLVRAQIMIRHPNYSGLQMNQVTQLYIPARFVNEIEVRQGGDELFKMEGGISLSEDPTIAFEFQSNGSETLDVRAVDTEGEVFSGAFPIEAAENG